MTRGVRKVKTTMLSNDAVLRLAAELSPADASELVAKMRSGNIKGDSLRILHNYSKSRLSAIVSASKIDRDELLKWAEIDNEIEAMLRQVYLF